MRAKYPWLLGIAIAAAPMSSTAATREDVVIAARAFGFTENAPEGELAVGIAYLPDNESSAEEADELEVLLGDGLKVGNLTLKPVLLKFDELAAADIKLVFLTRGTGSKAAKIAAVTKAKRIPCITLDIAQVHKGFCTMGIRSTPTAEIVVNRENAANCGLVFSSAFRMMITEL